MSLVLAAFLSVSVLLGTRRRPPPPPSPSLSLSSFELPQVLLAQSLGYLELCDIDAARLVCRAWARVQAQCPKVTCRRDNHVALSQNPKAIRHLVLDAWKEKNLDLSALGNLETLRIEPQGPVEVLLPPNFEGRVILDQHAFRDELKFLITPEIARVLHSVSWLYGSSADLERLLSLPCLASLTLLRAEDLSPQVIADCRLQQLVLVDCRTKLDFLDQLPCLTALGLVERERFDRLLPSDVPVGTRKRIERMDVRHFMQVSHNDLELEQYPRLRCLWLHSDFDVEDAPRAPQSMLSLETLELDAAEWTAFAPGLRLDRLRELVLRRYWREALDDFSGLELQKLKLSGVITRPSNLLRIRARLPVSLLVLELRDLTWVPESGTRAHTVSFAAEDFRSMSCREQARVRAAVLNLYLVPGTGYFIRPYLASSFS
jgi:hypothetical protein